MVQAAFRDGSRFLDTRGWQPHLPARTECGLDEVDRALRRLNGAAPYVKRNFLLACAHTVTSDGKVEVREMELPRAIADTLESPIPPHVAALDKVQSSSAEAGAV
jgi:hypothetical protein